jgi:glucose 1-dehydrogenase
MSRIWTESSGSQVLKGQTALVTGADSGIGAAVVMAFAKAGARVGINHRGDAETANEMAEIIRQQRGDAVAVKADVSKEDDVRSMFAAFVEIFGRLDILVANAGIQRDAPVTKMTVEQWRSVLDVNLTGEFLCAREAIKQFLHQDFSPASKARGKIICMSSVHETIPWSGHVNYAASKGGIMLMMQTLAQEVADKKIRINGIAPGVIKTKINKAIWSDPARAKKLLKLVPYGRIGDPEDVARAALWLASDDADYVTGTTLIVDGGMSLYPAFREAG